MWLGNILRNAIAAGLVALVAACGGGGGGGGYGTPPPTGTAPSGLSYPSPQMLTVGQAAQVSPTVTGTVTSYSISPSSLPAGLKFDTTSGVLSGKPTTITPQANYTVTATNSGGSTTATVAIAVNDVKPAFTYPSVTVALALGVTATAGVFQSSGGAITSWSVNPALPAGVNFDTNTGIFGGTPTAAAPLATYTVTATNSGGQATFALNLSVESGTLLELGHADHVGLMHSDGVHVVSEDVTGHWALWNYATGALIANGDSGCNPNSSAPCGCTVEPCSSLADVAGPSLVIQTPTGFELRSTTDGHLVTTIAFANVAAWSLASDGSYFAAGSSTGLAAWSAAGTALISETGDYRNAKILATPADILVASPAAGSNVVETIHVATAASTTGPQFQGAFKFWFADGGRFATAVNNTTLIYSKATVQAEAVSLPNAPFGGTGNWFWGVGSTPSNLNIYAVGGGTTPAATFPFNSSAASLGTAALALFTNSSVGTNPSNQVSVVDLTGATPVKVDYTLPVGRISVVGGNSATHWLAGSIYGVVIDGAGLPATSRYFGYGHAWSIAGSNGRVAIATASGQILYYNSSLQQEGTIQHFSAHLQLSADGTVLAALGDTLAGQGPAADYSVNVYSLPGGTVLGHWPYGNPATSAAVPEMIGLSGSGTVLSQISYSPREVSGITPGSNIIYQDTLGGGGDIFPIRLSPDGTLIAAATGNYLDYGGSGANILKNGTLVTAVTSWPVGWIDNNHLLTNTYAAQTSPPMLGSPAFTGALVLDATGKQVATSAIPELHEFQPLTADLIYSDENNTIYSVSSGTPGWVSSDFGRGIGAVVGSHVVFASGARVLALTH